MGFTGGAGGLKGLSPRVRGNPESQLKRGFDRGSIPARAGEPNSGAARRAGYRVYPRACGGTTARSIRTASLWGLSPRVRGNRGGRVGRTDGLRSIPARAGEPPRRPAAGGRSRVYPRACGGTARCGGGPRRGCGLSPRVRGNLGRRSRRRGATGSIPARAGEPPAHTATPRRNEVYPRACGGTKPPMPPAAKRAGLSPRVRGNQEVIDQAALDDGSIPARAGEPPRSRRSVGAPRVYPRACGGTARSFAAAARPSGLSPRVRGNPRRRRHCVSVAGSIPARAGEPVFVRGVDCRSRVYPRACGGTRVMILRLLAVSGLSPRVRGNPDPTYFDCQGTGSIPARAGEPRTARRRRCA